MLALINSPLSTLYKLLPDAISNTHIKVDDRMATRHICPCCSSILLRHISHNRVYWRCSHCHAPMSDWRHFE